MNIACVNCGKIITVPDIPLPADYTQRCTHCGHVNAISDEAPEPDLADWDTLDTTGTSTVTQQSSGSQEAGGHDLDALRRELFRTVEDNLRLLETRLRAEIKERAAAQVEKPSTFALETAKNVAQKQVLIGSGETAVLQVCRQALGDKGYEITEAKNLADASRAIAEKPFHIFVLDQKFLKSGPAGKNILRYIKRTPLVVRRCQLVMLVTPGVTSGDSQAFFRWGIDLNIHPRDLRNLNELIEEMLALKDEMLSPYLASA